MQSLLSGWARQAYVTGDLRTQGRADVDFGESYKQVPGKRSSRHFPAQDRAFVDVLALQSRFL